MTVKRSRNGGLKETFQRLADSHAALSQAQATLVSNQASLVGQLAQTEKFMDEARRENLEINRRTEERFSRIESILLHLVEVLPEALREKIGIRPQKQ